MKNEAQTGEAPGPIVEYSPYRSPKRKPKGSGEGSWICVERHVQKGYPLYWQWQESSIEQPPELPPEFKSLSKELPIMQLPNILRKSLRGNFNTDIVSEKMDEADDRREEEARKNQT